MAQETTPVVVVMDNSLYRHGIAMLLESEGDITVIAQADSAEAAAEALPRTPGCVVVLDIDADGGARGVSETTLCRGAGPSCRIVTISESGSTDRVLDLFDAGAHGYVLKESSARRLIDAVRMVARGETVVDSRLLGSMLGTLRDLRRRLEVLGDNGSAALLTGRQAQLMHLVAEGLTNRQIAAALGISESTVKNHLHQVFARLGVTSRSQAIAVSVRLGIVRP